MGYFRVLTGPIISATVSWARDSRLYIMIKLTSNWLGILLIFLLTACSDGRPDIKEAEKQFSQIYPGVQVTSIRITEDEVIARSFKFRYRKPRVMAEKEIEIQFMQKVNTGQWIPSPEPPKELP